MSPNEEALGRILRELGAVRGELSSMREHANNRHKTLADEMGEVRAEVRRANDTAAEAKRIAERSANDTSTMQRAVMDHTQGLVARVARVEKETGEQTGKLDVLVKAAQEQKIREDERKLIEDEKLEADTQRWKTVERWKSLAAWAWPIVAAVAGYAFAHWKP